MTDVNKIKGLYGPEWLGQAPPPAIFADIARSYGARLGDAIAFPGLINSHDHLAFNCYAPTGAPPYHDFLEWSRDVQAERGMIDRIESVPRPARAQFGLLKNLLWGMTAVADHGGKALPGEKPITVLTTHRDLHSPELENPRRWLTGRGTVVLHLAEGVSAESRQRALDFLERNLWRRPVAGVHGVSLERGDFSRLKAFIWCPASNQFLFGRSADASAAALETQLLFGTDSTLSAPGTLWDHLRQARGVVPDAAIFAALTEGPARFWRLRRQNDLVIARRRAAATWDAFFALTPDDILLVIRAGRPVLLDSSLVGATPLPVDFAPVAWGAIRKYVRMPVETMTRAVAPQLDARALIARFAGAVPAGSRAA
jgi:cytosine/adenosine deaminase-related metal-dependent hydrolase